MFGMTVGSFHIVSHKGFFFFKLNFSISVSDSVHHFSLAFIHCIVLSMMIVAVFRFRGYVSLLCLFQNPPTDLLLHDDF
jgi:hypothetical protein